MRKEIVEFLTAYEQQIDNRQHFIDTEEKELEQRLQKLQQERFGLKQQKSRLRETPLNIFLQIPPTCPACFAKYGTQFKMKPMNLDDKKDHFICPHCSFSLECEA